MARVKIGVGKFPNVKMKCLSNEMFNNKFQNTTTKKYENSYV